MDKTPADVISKIAKPIVEQRDMFLIDVEFKHGKTPEAWIFVDSETGGVDVDACSEISREINFALGEQDLFDRAYRLNVSSPGLSRPLSDTRQYAKNKGRTAKVKYKAGDGYATEEGVLADVRDDDFILQLANQELLKISFGQVVETKIVPKI